MGVKGGAPPGGGHHEMTIEGGVHKDTERGRGRGHDFKGKELEHRYDLVGI